MRLTFKLLNPFNFDADLDSKDYAYRHWDIASNKSAEIQISRFDKQHIIDFTIDLHWWGSDHAGPRIEASILGYGVSANVYDHRHWDYDNNCWDVYTQDEEW